MTIAINEVEVHRHGAGGDDLTRSVRGLSPLQHGWPTGLPGCHGRKRVLVARQGHTVRGQLAYVAFARRYGVVPPIVEARRISHAMPAEVFSALLASLLRRTRAARRMYLSFDTGVDTGVDTAVGARADTLSPELRAVLAIHGFEPTARRAPRWTRVVPLAGPVDLAQPQWKGVRRQMRAQTRFPVTLRPIVDVRWADRMREIKQQTYARRLGAMPCLDYPTLIQAAARHPEQLHIAGCFLTGDDGPASLVAWDCATFNGVVGTSEHGARAEIRLDDHALPSGYWTLMACIRWAQEQGAVAFDLGGVTEPAAPDYEQVKGINEFKARFGGEIVRGLEHEFVKRTVFDELLTRLR